MTKHLAHHLSLVNLYREERARLVGAEQEAREHAKSVGRQPKHLAEPRAQSPTDDAMRDVDTWAVATAVTDESGRAA